MNRPDTLHDVVKAWRLDREAYKIAVAGFLDSFYVNPDRRQSMIDAEPALTNDAYTDAWLGAVAEHLARRWNLVVPGWTQNARRFLRAPHFATNIESLKALLLTQSPLAFRKRMIFVEHEPLRRARMPKPDVTDTGAEFAGRANKGPQHTRADVSPFKVPLSH